MLDAETHRRVVEDWRKARAARLGSPTGWLALVERIALDPGETALPFGTVTLEGTVVRLRVAPGQVVTAGGVPVTDRVLLSDEDPGGPDRLTFEGKSYELFRRGDAFALRVKDPRAPALARFAGIPSYPVDLAWRVVGRWERYDPPRQTVHQFEIGTGLPRPVPGIAHFEIGGQALSLEPTQEGQRLAFMFGDLTNRTETYGAGRFMYAELPVGEEVVLDFNQAYNPPCAFNELATCPVVPRSNRLPVAITAGEKRPAE